MFVQTPNFLFGSAIEARTLVSFHVYTVIHSLCQGVVLESYVCGEPTELAGDPLHALLALHDAHVDVVDALNDVGHGADL